MPSELITRGTGRCCMLRYLGTFHHRGDHANAMPFLILPRREKVSISAARLPIDL
jgi:hypothetical protein